MDIVFNSAFSALQYVDINMTVAEPLLIDSFLAGMHHHAFLFYTNVVFMGASKVNSNEIIVYQLGHGYFYNGAKSINVSCKGAH
jgi:hypothetical protein